MRKGNDDMQAETVIEKHECHECGGQFIMGKDTPRRVFAPVCPYCGSIDTEKMVWDDQENIGDFGCFTIRIPEQQA